MVSFSTYFNLGKDNRNEPLRYGTNMYIHEEPPHSKHWNTTEQTKEPQWNKIWIATGRNCYLIRLILTNCWTNMETQLHEVRTTCADEQSMYLMFISLNNHWTKFEPYYTQHWTVTEEHRTSTGQPLNKH